MSPSKLLPLLLVQVVLICSQAEAAIVNPSEAAAVFNLNAVTGWVRFFESEEITTILVNLEGLDEPVTEWSIHQFPVDETLSPSDRCSLDNVGNVYDPRPPGVVVPEPCGDSACQVGDLSGRFLAINTSGLAWFNDTERAVTLQGSLSVIGRSVRLRIGTDLFICATIRSKTEAVLKEQVISLQATFVSPVAGTVYFRQNSNEPTVIFGKLFWVTESRMDNVEWSISSELLNETYRSGVCGDFDMANVTEELTDRHEMITLSNTAQPYSNNAFLFTDNILKLMGQSESLDGSTLLLHQGDNIVGCAPIGFSERIEAFQYPDFNLQIRQVSPYENSTLVQSGEFNAELNHAILNAAWMTNGLCPVTDEVYNPLAAVAPGSEELFRTPDLFAYGDISGKFGSLLAPSQELALTELPMYGPFSMLGLTTRHISNSEASYRMCDALVPLKDENTLLAKATFVDGTVKGAIYFLQRQDPQFSGLPGVTNIIVDLYYADSTQTQTTGHAWKVQEGACSSAAGSPYNPFNVDRGNSYDTECTPYSPLRCEYGDLSGKHNTLTIDPLGMNRQTKAVVDVNLQLDGIYTIVGQSIGIYSPGSSMQRVLACAEVELVKSSDAQFDVIVAFPETADFERVAFTKELVRMASLDDKVDPSDVLILHEEVGTIASAEDGSICALAQVKLIADSPQQANSYSTTLQESVCLKLADNGCMKQLPEYETLCGRDEPTGSDGSSSAVRSMVSLSVTFIVILTGLLINVLF